MSDYWKSTHKGSYLKVKSSGQIGCVIYEILIMETQNNKNLNYFCLLSFSWFLPCVSVCWYCETARNCETGFSSDDTENSTYTNLTFLRGSVIYLVFLKINQ